MSDSRTDLYKLHSHEATQQFAACFGKLLEGGEILALQGDLGAGKTCFVQGLAKGLDVPSSIYVRSPTFALMDEYPGRVPLFHLDLYRLADEDELEDIGWRDCLDGHAVVAIEWANRIPEALPSIHISVIIHINEDDTRTFEVRFPQNYQELQRKLKDEHNQAQQMVQHSTDG